MSSTIRDDTFTANVTISRYPFLLFLLNYIVYIYIHIVFFIDIYIVCTLNALHRVSMFRWRWGFVFSTGLGDGGQFKNKTEYSTLTRFSYCQCRLRSVFGSVLKEFGWKDLVIIYDVDDVHSNELGMTLNEGLTQEGYMPIVIKYCECSSQKIQSILQDASKHARGRKTEKVHSFTHSITHSQ